MLKSELTPPQLATYALFVNTLTKVGWNTKGWDALFDNEANLKPEALAEYASPELTLELSYFIEENYLLLECRNGETDLPIFRVRLYLSNVTSQTTNLTTILNTIIARQNELSDQTYPDLIKAVIPTCKLALLEVEGALVKLSLEENG